MLAHLALEPGPHARDVLAALLWGDATVAAARTSLRQALRGLRTVLGDLIATDHASAELRPGLECDVLEFRRLAAADPAAAIRHDLGRFLSGFAVRGAPAFEEWVETTRATLRGEYVRALRAVAAQAMHRCRWHEVIAVAERWLATEPLSDEAARIVAEARFMGGERGAALQGLAAFSQRVRAETGVDPDPAVAALAGRIAAGRRHERRVERANVPEPSFEGPLVGRETEWRALMDAWDGVMRGDRRAVLIEGDLGMGKTRLAEDVLRWARTAGATVLKGQGYDAAGGIPYAPIADALSDALEAPGLPAVSAEWLAEVARLHPGIRDRFPRLPRPSSPTDEDRRWRLFEGVAQILLGLAAERPTVLAIDDLQLCDGDTCALLHFLARRIESGPILFLFTASPGEVEPTAPTARLCRALHGPETAVVSLTPLDEDAVFRLIRQLGRTGAADAGARLAARLHALTDGNPFHIVEILKSLFAQGLLTVHPDTGMWQVAPVRRGAPDEPIELPRTVRDAVRARCTGLPYEQRDLLAVVAVAGRGATTELLSLILGMSRLRLAALADSLVDRRLLVQEGGSYRCAHPVIHDVVRAGLTPARRREVHRALALALEQVADSGQAGDVARHAEWGGEHALACRAALRAADMAAGHGALDEALAWLDLAARVAPDAAAADEVQRGAARLLGGVETAERRPRKRAGPRPSGLMQSDLDLDPAR